MLVDILNKLLMMSFFMSLLNVVRHAYYFIQAFFTSTPEEPTKYRISNTSLIILGVSIAYLLSVIFTGIQL